MVRARGTGSRSLSVLGSKSGDAHEKVGNGEMIREQDGFPANKVSEVRTIIDPTTAEV
ncbi:hypothetical protein AVDCRST_MAG82-2528 [uncultured Rubrobacteraceae bacterium]|uniref:Uncharacterized protein n=1 Tax=uncultured Rubrobacteraceae bacterium TaxID=349277 RepID=A0A6J4QCN5_9ACTN|nr:hypothetical protein AVDCRST_MAG82-2528 [uncultured Rubrobacteraceae bacterium]